MKILILANSDIGLFKFRKELIKELVKKNEIIIALPQGEYIQQLKDMGCTFVETPINRRGTNPLTDYNLIKTYMKLIKNVKPNMVLTYTIKPNVYGGLVCTLTNTPYIANVTGVGSAIEKPGLLKNFILILYKMAFSKAKAVFFQNKENMDLFKRKKIGLGKHKLIPGSGVNIEEYSLLKYPEDNSINFLFIARIMKEKGIDQYIEAAEYITKKYSNVYFHILGKSDEKYGDLLKSMQEKNVVYYHGRQKNIRSFLALSHCTIHPTYYPEGMSNVLLESAASGRPVITTDRSGCREIVEEGSNGFIVEAKNTRSLVEKIEEFLELNNQERKKMGLLGREKVKKEFDRDIVIEAYFKEIEIMR